MSSVISYRYLSRAIFRKRLRKGLLGEDARAELHRREKAQKDACAKKGILRARADRWMTLIPRALRSDYRDWPAAVAAACINLHARRNPFATSLDVALPPPSLVRADQSPLKVIGAS